MIVPSAPEWTWQHGLYQKDRALIAWSNGSYRWWIMRGQRTIASGRHPTIHGAMAAVEKAERV